MFGFLSFLYPLFLWLTWDSVPHLAHGVVLGLIIALRAIGTQQSKWIWLGAAVAMLIGTLSLVDFKWVAVGYPIAVNTALFLLFALGLRDGQTPIIEKLASQREELNDRARRYIRRVTYLWCSFFVVNIFIIIFLATQRDMSVLVRYTGGWSYLVMGALFAFEWLFRMWYKRQDHELQH